MIDESTLNPADYEAMRCVRDGADVYNKLLARCLRALVAKHQGLVVLVRARRAPIDGAARQPIFGAILTAPGRLALRQWERLGCPGSGRSLSVAQGAMLAASAMDGDPLGHLAGRGRSHHGGAVSTYYSLIRRGFLDKETQALTEAGRWALVSYEFSRMWRGVA